MTQGIRLMNTRRVIKTIILNGIPSLEKIISWCNEFNPCIILNSNSGFLHHKDNYHSYDLLIAAGKIKSIEKKKNIFTALKEHHTEISDWLFGYFSYDVKNQVENLYSENFDGIGADEYYFFQPRYVFEFSGKNLSVHFLPEEDDEKTISDLINSFSYHQPDLNQKSSLNIQARINKEEYLEQVNKIKVHIKRGDIYEMNFCMEFFSEDAFIDPVHVYHGLNTISPMPFSTFFRIDQISLMCASPERFLAKRGNKIISQPIKGTARRGKDESEDRMLTELLRNNLKEQSENVMIVDLVRNDLSRTASRGSVRVEELYGIKTFKQLHQMISTVTSEMREDVHFTDVIKNAFPMGSMTGAPKIRAMELIERYEMTKRGIYSGSVGYITPGGDFDFNVVIRSILYNTKNHYLSFMAGSAITDASDEKMEYEECLLKASSMKKVLGY